MNTFRILLVLNLCSFAGQLRAAEGLCEDYAEHFLIGTIYHGHLLGNHEPNERLDEELDLIAKEFNCITAENCMKPSFTQPENGVFTFFEADEFMNHAERMGLTVVGHTLIWKNDAPEWFFVDDEGEQVSREFLIERMTHHIKTVVGRYKGRIAYWDVVNEAVAVRKNAEGIEEACYKSSPWYDIIGPEYIELAYRAAHEADPDAKLLYNDFNLYEKRKIDFTLQMIKDLRADGVPVHGLGYQGHMFLDFPSIQRMEPIFRACQEADIPLSITELDISVLPNAWMHRGASVEDNFEYAEKFNPYADGAPEEILQRQAERYR